MEEKPGKARLVAFQEGLASSQSTSSLVGRAVSGPDPAVRATGRAGSLPPRGSGTGQMCCKKPGRLLVEVAQNFCGF